MTDMYELSLESAGRGETLFQALVSTSVDGIMVIDEIGHVLVYSDACARLFGYAAAEVLGHNVRMLMPEPYTSGHDEYLAHYRRTGERHVIGIGRDVVGRRKDGSTFPMYLSVGEGHLDGRRIFVGIIHDISGEKERDRRIQELQDELLHATRVTAMGQMSSAIAHELNQPLGAILAYAGALQRLMRAEEPPRAMLQEAVDHVAQDAARAGQIIRRLRAFVEKRESNRSLENVAALLAEALALGTFGQGMPIGLDTAPDVPDLFIDKIQIQQVLVNLIRNAVEATEGMADPVIRVSARADGPEHVRIAVADNGPGLSPAVADRLFEPFATTKEGGMGMGLNICRTIVEAHEGRIWAEPRAGGGMVFSFRLPIAAVPP